MRKPTGASLALDLGPGDKQVTTLVKSVANDPGTLRIAAAYITGDAATLLGLPARGSLKRLRVLCDAESGNCDPTALTALSKRGADVRCIPRLHAKVYASSARAVVGSPNLSPAALKAGSKNATVEAAALISDVNGVKRVNSWFDDLHRRADRWTEIRADDERYAGILRAYASKAKGGPRWHKNGKRRKPSIPLLAALQDPNRDIWRDIVFSLITDWVNPEHERATAVANREGLGLSADASHEVLVGPDRDDVSYYRKQRSGYADGRGPVAIGIYVKVRRGRVTKVDSIDEEAGRLVDVLTDKNRLFIYYEPAWTDIDLGPKAVKAVVAALNTGLKANRYKLKDTGRFVRAAELARLLPTDGAATRLRQ